MSPFFLLLLVLVLVVGAGALPAWPYSRSWGYGPSGIAGVLVFVLLVWILLGRR